MILDNTSADFTYGGPQDWTIDEQPYWYGGSSTSPRFANSQIFGSFEVAFEGTSIAFTGNTPAATLSQTITVSIDGGTPYSTSYMDLTPPSYLQWYQSPTLSDGKHVVKVDGVDGTSLDYATITVGEKTPLTGRKIIVDNEDPAIRYSGTWTRTPDEFIPGHIPAGLPFRNSTHRSTTAGNTITFKFSGTSLAVYGVFSWANLGILGATYTIDGGVSVAGSYPVTTSSPQYIDGVGAISNFLFVTFDNLSTGEHTLVIRLLQCENKAFAFDYITYTPSFANLASMPGFVPSASTSSGLVPTYGSTSVSSNAGASPTTSQASQQSALGTKKTPVGSIVGGVVGALLAFALIAFLFFWLRRRKQQKNSPPRLKMAKLDNSSALSVDGESLWDPPTIHPFPVTRTDPSSGASSGLSPASSTAGTSHQSFPQHQSLSARDVKQRNTLASGASSGLSPTSSSVGSPSNVASSDQNSVVSPGPSSWVSAVNSPEPPAYYEAVSVHRRSAFPSQ